VSTVAAGCRYARAAGALWRDTGSHVVVLPDRHDAEVVVLGGGGAVLWRLLERSLSLGDIELQLHQADGHQPETSAVLGCLEDLVARGVLTSTGQGEPW
jgi:hypothetical protein